MEKPEILIEQINIQFEYLLSLRALFPYMNDSLIGESIFRTAPYYRNKEFDVHFNFGRKLAQEDIDRIISIGHWANQNYIIRICSLLEANKIIPKENEGKIDQTIDGWEEVDLVRRLRNQFAHSSGKYDFKEPKEKKLYERIVIHFNVSLAKASSEATEFPIPIDTVIEPLTESCKKYIKNYFIKKSV